MGTQLKLVIKSYYFTIFLFDMKRTPFFYFQKKTLSGANNDLAYVYFNVKIGVYQNQLVNIFGGTSLYIVYLCI